MIPDRVARSMRLRANLTSFVRLAAFAATTGLVAMPLCASTLWSFYNPTTDHRAKAGDWKLRVERNRFSDEIVCRLHSHDHHVIYFGKALGFRFGTHLDTSTATYRLDDGPVRKWRDDLPELVRLGSPIDGPGLDSATGGIIWLPISILSETNRITIQARADRRPKVFHLRGFAGLFAIAQARGCAPDARFVR